MLAGKARDELGTIMQKSLAARLTETTSDKARAALQKERQKPLRSPILIAVAALCPEQPNIVDIENVEAVAAAVQNMLLTAEEMGLACMWRTGDTAYDPQVKKWLGLSVEDHIVAFVYLGYPALPQTERHPTPIEAKTAWLGWQD